MLLDPKASIRWYARLPVRSLAYGTLDLFSRANTPKGASAIRDLFGAASARDLALKMARAFENESLTKYLQGERFHFGVNFPQLLNWEELGALLKTS